MKNNEISKRSKLNSSREYSYKQSLEHMVEDKLHESMWDRSNDINVQCIDKGTVVLSGFVDVLGDKVEAEEIVNTISDVTEIENKITIPMDKPFTNTEIQNQILDSIQSSIYSTHLQNVTPLVDGGVARLEGTVENDWYKKHAQELASNCYNINEVVNKIKVL